MLVGTRGSALALAQTRLVVDLLHGKTEAELVMVPLKTSGDALPHERLVTDGKTAFTGDIDRELAEGRIDIAVHSMKDLPLLTDERLVIGATPKRGDPRDALVSPSGATLGRLRKGARIGTSSVRRMSQLLALRGDIEVVELRGNVDTRLRKIEERGLDGAVLAAAGLHRLGLGSRITQAFGVEEVVPAVCQGTLAVEARAGDSDVLAMLEAIDDPDTRASSECERAFSEELGGDCDVPLGAYATVAPGRMVAIGLVADPLGKRSARAEVEGDGRNPKALGRELARKVKERGGAKIMEGIAG
ncbi:MAG: hydroxymethylbilane synthase [Nitrososphaerota archaeon]|nr:hydroxymethylbilane synthase [Nitrososphaerota archaeon]MDG6961971.1 hydroxymethylbilane synthase [Nitrososphaerota archaeon]MDG6962776.1 hydroxymethylbilane synthase [Nitrososphaerota archaeon]MDG6970115.1 hydroxymethylbilane synthase [Nitrososphaerota archaeon]MDG6984824.1 hydroxymethylbilane synthase [Nitrososphaerota archaeon]